MAEIEETGQHKNQLPPGAHPSFMSVIKTKQRIKEKLSNVKHKIGIYSAKGGVGKTTVSVNTAYALSARGFKVGLLDADIDCPNISMFLGIDRMMDVSSFPLKPIEKYGIKAASTAMIVDDTQKPIIWRGPIIVKMLYDFFENTDWGELDYLVIDLPPGTSDAPLTIMQVLDLDGFVIVTNPQRIAGVNSIRSGLMARRLNVALLGVVENMSSGKPSKNTDDVVATLGTKLLGTVKMDTAFSANSDEGRIPSMESKDILKMFDPILDGLGAKKG
jgi:ATP-binding protein involved in chromosome partitioning